MAAKPKTLADRLTPNAEIRIRGRGAKGCGHGWVTSGVVRAADIHNRLGDTGDIVNYRCSRGHQFHIARVEDVSVLK